MKKKNLQISIFLLIIFIFFFVFFYKIHPITIFDTDDWLYTYASRRAIPLINEWNPTRILPEILMPLVSSLSSMTLFPLVGNYVVSLTIMHSIVVSLCITAYTYCFIKLIEKIFKTNNYLSICISIIFLMLHFLIFRSQYDNNEYMFLATNACCYYYYIIPALLNCSIVMYFLANDSFNKSNNILKKSLIILLCYLAIFSNLFQSIILAAFSFSLLVFEFIKEKYKFNIKNIITFIKQKIGYFLILLSWGFSQILEMNGGRAKSLSGDNSFVSNISTTLSNLFNMHNKLNRTFVWIFIISMIVLIIIVIKKKLYKNKYIITLSATACIVLIYLILVSAKSGPGYITRPDVLLGLVFFIFIAISSVFTLLSKKFKIMSTILPLLILIMFFEINTNGKTFKESNILNLSHESCLKIDDIIIKQIKTAVDLEKDEVTLYIPKIESETKDNWPIATYGVDRIANALYKHGVIKRNIKVNYELSDELYKGILR